MIYGEEKLLQMARSILPSRRSCRNTFNRIRRNKRRSSRQDLRRGLLEGEDSEVHLRRDDNNRIRGAVVDRREGDKVNHFQKWAIKVTDGLEPDARLARIRKILPDGVIGDHALAHVRRLDEFELDIVKRYQRSWRDVRGPHPFQHRFAPSELDLREVLSEVLLAPKAGATLQRYMQAMHSTCEWVLSYGEPTRRCHKYSRFVRKSFGHYTFIPTTRIVCTPTVLVKRALGPSQPPFVPKRGTGLLEFLEALEEAERAPRWVNSKPWVEEIESSWDQTLETEEFEEPAQGGVERILRNVRLNPAHHPEWVDAVKNFCEVWVDQERDLHSVKRALRID